MPLRGTSRQDIVAVPRCCSATPPRRTLSRPGLGRTSPVSSSATCMETPRLLARVSMCFGGTFYPLSPSRAAVDMNDRILPCSDGLDPGDDADVGCTNSPRDVHGFHVVLLVDTTNSHTACPAHV